MPPYSRGSVKRKANDHVKRPDRTTDATGGRDAPAGIRPLYRDPLTTIVTLIAYPILLVALVVLHVVYYASFKAGSRLRYLVRHLKATRTADGFTNGVLSLCRLSSVIERHAEVRLRMLAEANELIGKHEHPVSTLKSTGKTARIVRIPQHVALAIGPKPMRWRSLMLRTIDGRRGQNIAEQHAFIMDNLRSILRCAKTARIDTLTVFDVEGYLRTRYACDHLGQWIEEAFPDLDVQIVVPAYDVALRHSYPSTGKLYDPSRFSIRLHILGPVDSTQAIANAANILLKTRRTASIDANTIDNVLTRSAYPREPDLLILHGGARQVSTLHGFPPWLVRLAEVYHDFDAPSFRPLTLCSFEKAIGRYMHAEQRYGR